MKKTVLAVALAIMMAGCSGNKTSVPAFHESNRAHTPEQKAAYEDCLKDPRANLEKNGMLSAAAPLGAIAGQAIKGNPYGMMAAKSMAFGPIGLITGGLGLASAGISYAFKAGQRNKEEMSTIEICLAGYNHKVIGWYNISDPKGELQPPVTPDLEKKMKEIENRRNVLLGKSALPSPAPAAPVGATDVVPAQPAAQEAKTVKAVEPLTDDKTIEQVTHGLTDAEMKDRQAGQPSNTAMQKNPVAEPQKGVQ